MQDDFSSEILLVNKLRKMLLGNGYEILQLVCSGGQAHFSISYINQGKRKNTFPDLVAFDENNIFVGEVKSGFDESDYKKLLGLKASKEALKSLLRNINIRTKRVYSEHDIVFLLVHADSSSQPVPDVRQLVYHDSGFNLIPSSECPPPQE
ncbi:hypothetical protein [Pseudidiomarina aquimaris]|uniref:hypothetical protein n=1 Tax=Pseudidiomarina aquimaris TaxID=641841 RepID=UPI003A973F74